MTGASVVYPLLLAAVIAVVTTTAHRRLPPSTAARFVTVALVLITIAALPTLALAALAFVTHVPGLGAGVEWCTRTIGVHHPEPLWVGGPAAACLGIGAVRVARLLRDHRRLRCNLVGPVEVTNAPTPYAMTMPGRGGRIVVSTGLLTLLDPAETEIVLAHERAHAHYRHDRFVLAAELAAALLPPLRSLSARVLYSVERWADEAAARACGDRRLVATTLGKVAMRSAYPTGVTGVTGFAGLGVTSRVRALLEPPPRSPGRPWLAALGGSLAVTAVLSLYQLHHLQRLAAALCIH